MIETLKKSFKNIFNHEHEEIYFAPGRINLIGEHIDYHGGKVLPAAISLGTYGFVRKRNDQKICLYSVNFKDRGIIEHSLPVGPYHNDDHWTNYVKAVIDTFEKENYPITQGFDLLVYGNIPNGSGLSSSASLEVLVAWILKTQHNYDISRKKIALMTQKAENQYIGVNCGIMDQYAVSLGKKNHAMYLDTDSVEHDYIPLEFKDASILIMNSNRKRGLEDSHYNERRIESEKAHEILLRDNPNTLLTELSMEKLKNHPILRNHEILYRRAHHVVSENLRTIQAIEAIQNHDLESFGQVLNQSHASLRNDYEVSSYELDVLVHTAQNSPGVYGARMTGAGFGGCAIALVDNRYLDEVMDRVKEVYAKETKYDADIYLSEIGDGVKLI